MNKINFIDLKKEVKTFVKEKRDIIKLEDKIQKIEKDIKEKKEEINSFSYLECRLYDELTEEIDCKEKEAKELSEEKNNKEINLKRNIESKKEEIIEGLNGKLEIIDTSLEKMQEEKELLEEKIKLNEVSKEEFLKMNLNQQQEVRKAKEKYLINKEKLNELTPEFEFLGFLMENEEKDKNLETTILIDNVNSKFNYDNIENVFGETVELEKSSNTIELVEEDKTSKVKNEIVKEHNIKPKKSGYDDKKNTGNKIQEIFIDEYNNRVEILTENNKKSKVINRDISEILSNKKQIFNDNNISDKCLQVSKSKIKRFFLKRKLNPVIIKALGDNNEPEAIDEYVKSVYSGKQIQFKLLHDLRQTSLTGFKKSMMKRFAKVEESIQNAEVLRDRKHLKLLEDKTVGNELYVRTKNLAKELKVDNGTLETLNSISEKASGDIEVKEDFEYIEDEK